MGRDEVLKVLTDDLVAQGGEAIQTHEAPGPLATVVLTARALEGLYPGQNARVAVLDGERVYGAALGPGLGAFLRDRGLDPRAIPPATLVALHNVMALDDSLVIAEDPAPTRIDASGADLIRLVTLDPMSGEATTQELVIPDDGPVELRAVPSDDAAIVPISRAVGLARALADGDALAMMRALAPFSMPLDDAERALLARVVALPNEAMAYDAVARLDPSGSSASALRDATGDDPEARARVVAIATSAHGEAFARLVRGAP